jgi:hypothetical protein
MRQDFDTICTNMLTLSNIAYSGCA